MPPLYKQIVNLLTDTWNVVKYKYRTKQSIKVSPDIQTYRWNICTSCESLDHDRCNECGCFMKVKVQLASANCPLHKWNALDDVHIDDCEICPP